MNITARVQHLLRDIDNITRDIDQRQGDCDAALVALIAAATDARANLTAIRDEEIGKRRSNQEAKQRHADALREESNA